MYLIKFLHFVGESPKKSYKQSKCSETPRKCSETPRKCSESPRKCSETPRKCSETPRKSSETPMKRKVWSEQEENILSEAIAKETPVKDVPVNASPKKIYDKIKKIKSLSSSPQQVFLIILTILVIESGFDNFNYSVIMLNF